MVGQGLFNFRKHSQAKITVMPKCIRITGYDGHLRMGVNGLNDTRVFV